MKLTNYEESMIAGDFGYPRLERSVCVPTITDPRGIDLCRYRALKQSEEWALLEQRAISAFESFGILMTNTCINYQIFQAPVFGAHLAFGDTGSVIYANSVCGARSNFEGGPSAVAPGNADDCNADQRKTGAPGHRLRHCHRTRGQGGL
jgi:hypothetical protein